MELISVIVPIYNVEKYLRQCLNSLLTQTYNNIEVIMVDDGSPDNCGAICDEYARKYGNFIAVHKENAGLGMARNTGLEYVTGKYVMFLDSDDYIDSELIQILYEAMKINRVDISKSGFRRINNSGNIKAITNYNEEKFIGEKAASEFLPRLIGSAPNKKDSYEMSVCASLYNMEIIRKNEIKFSSERDSKTTMEDLFFNLDYSQFADGACVIKYVGYNYRINEKSLSRSYQTNMINVYFDFYDFMRARLESLQYGKEAFCRLGTLMLMKFRKCIHFEKKSISGKSMFAALLNIKKICCDERTQKIIRDYPVKELTLRRKFFVNMIKYKMYVMLYVFLALGIV